MKWLIQQCAKLAGQRNAVKLLRAHAVTKNILKYGDPHFFQQVFIEINGHCNRTCRYCPNSVEALPESFMSLDRFDTILRRLREINWTGLVAYHYLNEPLLHPHLCGFIRQTIRLLPKSKPVLFTNGDFLTPKMAENLIDSGLYRCTITRHVPVTKEWDERIPAIIKSNPEIFRMNIIRLGGMMNPAGIMKPNAANKWLQKNVNYCVSPTQGFRHPP